MNTRWLTRGWGGILLTLWLATQTGAQPIDPAWQQALEGLKQGQQQILQEFQTMRRLLQAPQRSRPAAPEVRGMIFNLGDNPIKGEPAAPLTLVEFTDYQCPFCGRYIRETYPQIDQEYISMGKVRYVVLDFPLEAIHQRAFKAAEATHCAQEQGKFWEMHARLFAPQAALGPWSAHAEALRLDVIQFEACLTDNRYASAIRHDMAAARKAGATGTPSFLLARSDPSDPTRVTGLAFLQGAQSFSSFKSLLDNALAAP